MSAFLDSDVSEIPEETYPLLKDCEILILVSLFFSSIRNKHTAEHKIIVVVWLTFRTRYDLIDLLPPTLGFQE